MTVHTAAPAASIVPSQHYRVTVNGADVFVYSTEVASYAILSAEGSLQVDVEAAFPFQRVLVRPLQSGIRPQADGNNISFTVDGPRKLSVEFDGDIRKPLFLLINPPETEKPDRSDPSVRFFEAGHVYEIGKIELKSDETVYIEEGAVVYAWITARNARNVKVIGRGILDGSKWGRGEHKRENLIKLIECDDVLIDGITLVDGPSWHVIPIACNRVDIRNVNIIGKEGTGDGFDIVGSSDVTVDNCFARVKDDCVAVKAVGYQDEAGCRNVERVRVTRCVFWNAEWGNAIEIGYETRADHIRDIVFEDIDVIRTEYEGYQSGGVFTIHNGDRAIVENVRYENIRVEQAMEKLVDIKILHSKYSLDAERGYVRDIRFKDIRIVDGPFPVSIIRGFEDGGRLITDVTFDNLTFFGQRATSANEARMVVELAQNIRFV